MSVEDLFDAAEALIWDWSSVVMKDYGTVEDYPFHTEPLPSQRKGTILPFQMVRNSFSTIEMQGRYWSQIERAEAGFFFEAYLRMVYLDFADTYVKRHKSVVRANYVLFTIGFFSLGAVLCTVIANQWPGWFDLACAFFIGVVSVGAMVLAERCLTLAKQCLTRHDIHSHMVADELRKLVRLAPPYASYWITETFKEQFPDIQAQWMADIDSINSINPRIS